MAETTYVLDNQRKVLKDLIVDLKDILSLVTSDEDLDQMLLESDFFPSTNSEMNEATKTLLEAHNVLGNVLMIEDEDDDDEDEEGTEA